MKSINVREVWNVCVPESEKMMKACGHILKEHMISLEERLTSQTWDSLSSKINNDSNGLLLLLLLSCFGRVRLCATP